MVRDWDNPGTVRILADGLSTTTTFAVNDADELVSATDTNGGTTYFEYDAWGRMVRKYMGTSQSPTFEATYEYKYDDKLVAVTSNFPDEGSVTYEYGGDGLRRSRTANGATTVLNWGIMGLLSEATPEGLLIQSNVGNLAIIVGSTPASGDYMHYVHDACASVRSAVDDVANTISHVEYSPFGDAIDRLGVFPTQLFTGHWHDETTGIYLTLYRAYDPATARWIIREPTGEDGPNLYHYVLNNPIAFVDPDGRSAASVFSSWFGGRRGDWFDRTAEWMGRCGGPAATFTLLSLLPGAVLKFVGRIPQLTLVDGAAGRVLVRETAPALFDLGADLGSAGGAAISVGDVLYDGPVVRDWNSFVDKLMGKNPNHSCLP